MCVEVGGKAQPALLKAKITIFVLLPCAASGVAACCACAVLCAVPGGASKAQACVTVLHRTLLQDGFKVLETSGPAESVELLTRTTRWGGALLPVRRSSPGVCLAPVVRRGCGACCCGLFMAWP